MAGGRLTADRESPAAGGRGRGLGRFAIANPPYCKFLQVNGWVAAGTAGWLGGRLVLLQAPGGRGRAVGPFKGPGLIGPRYSLLPALPRTTSACSAPPIACFWEAAHVSLSPVQHP